jgi:hypothetical protein
MMRVGMPDTVAGGSVKLSSMFCDELALGPFVG